MGRLDEVDLTLRLTRKEEAKELAAQQDRLLRLRLALGGQIGGEIGPPLCVVFEGWDASGKGGAIKRLVDHLDPRHVRVSQFAAPTYDEKRHHFLWRFWPELPGWGGMAVFDRSWYGRVLVERVEGFATDEQWQRAYDEIVGFESTLVAEGMILAKFWMHLSPDEQAAPVRPPQGRPAQVVEAHRRGLAQPGEARRSTSRPSRTCWPAPTTRPRRGTSSRPRTSATPGSPWSARSARRSRPPSPASPEPHPWTVTAGPSLRCPASLSRRREVIR